MGFNYAIEKAKFEREWTQLRVEYEKAGMSNEKINILQNFKSRGGSAQSEPPRG